MRYTWMIAFKTQVNRWPTEAGLATRQLRASSMRQTAKAKKSEA